MQHVSSPRAPPGQCLLLYHNWSIKAKCTEGQSGLGLGTRQTGRRQAGAGRWEAWQSTQSTCRGRVESTTKPPGQHLATSASPQSCSFAAPTAKSATGLLHVAKQEVGGLTQIATVNATVARGRGRAGRSAVSAADQQCLL